MLYGIILTRRMTTIIKNGRNPKGKNTINFFPPRDLLLLARLTGLNPLPGAFGIALNNCYRTKISKVFL